MTLEKEAEFACISSALINKDAMLTMFSQTVPTDFSYYQGVVQVMSDLHKAGKAVDSVALHQKGIDAKMLAELQQGVCSSANISDYCKQVLDHAARRKVRSAAEIAYKQSEKPAENVNEIISEISSKIRGIITDREEQTISIKDLLNMKDLQAREDYIKTGYVGLDNILHGLFPGELTILAARPSQGKTSLALNIAEYVSQSDMVLFFSAEMPKKAITIKMLSNLSKLPFMKIKTGSFTKTERETVDKAIETTSQYKFYINDECGIDIDRLVASAERFAERQKIGLIVVDYIQLLSTNVKGNSNERVTDISKKLKGLARNLNVPVLALSQLSRECEKNDRVPIKSDLRDSGSLEQDADVIIFIAGEVKPIENATSLIKNIIIAKQRNGPIGSVDMLFYWKYTKFQDQ